MKFKRVELHAFRAYETKENATFDFTLPDDKIAKFISIYAPNGFGKTSFYDGVEWAVTKNISRFNTYEEISKAERKLIKKEQGYSEKQYVLKNKDSDEENGYVHVFTDSKEFKNTTSTVSRAGSTDFLKTEVENKYFKNVILSQDGIDNFLKAGDDKSRYNKFISNFGDKNLAKYYKNIEELEKENDRRRDAINHEIQKINEFLEDPVDDKIFESSNEKINELNKNNSDKLDLIDGNYNEIKKGELETKLLQQKESLTNQIEYFENILIPKLPNWLKDSEQYFKTKIEWEATKNKVKDFVELKDITININITNEKINKSSAQKEEFLRLAKLFPTYKTLIKEINEIENSVLEKNAVKINNEKDLNQILLQYNELSKQIELLEKDKKEIDELLINIPKIYEDIKGIEEFNEKNESFEKRKVSVIQKKEAIKNNIFIDISSQEKYKLKVEEIESYIQKNNLNKELLSSIKKRKAQHQQYNYQLNDLLSLGIKIIDETQGDTCPLCNTKQDSYEILKSKVLNSPLLNRIEKELMEEEEKILFSIKENDKKIEEEKNLIILDFDKDLEKIKAELISLNHKLKAIFQNRIEKDIKSFFSELICKTQNKSQKELLEQKIKKQSELQISLIKLYDKKTIIELSKKEKTENTLIIDESIKSLNNILEIHKGKKEYINIHKYMNHFEAEVNILKSIENDINNINIKINKNNKILVDLNEKKSTILIKYNISTIDSIDESIEKLNDKVFKLYTEDIFTFESVYEQFFLNKIIDLDTVKKDIQNKKLELTQKLSKNKVSANLIEILENNTANLLKFIENKKKSEELEKEKKALVINTSVATKLREEREKLETKINKDVEAFFHEDLINQIYEKIDPHPDYKKVKFECHFEKGVGKLNVFVNDDSNSSHISPSLYYSTAQLNVLSLSIFLAKALNVKDEEDNNVDCIFIDDPIQSMDSINILSTIDLLRSLVVNHNKQIILSTHDENFHRLLEKKIPTNYFDSKFIELETFGKIKVS